MTASRTEKGVILHLLPLDVAASSGHLEVVRVLLQQLGIEGCGGETSDRYALELACVGPHVDIITMLMDAGVVDNGKALRFARKLEREAAVKTLLQWQAV